MALDAPKKSTPLALFLKCPLKKIPCPFEFLIRGLFFSSVILWLTGPACIFWAAFLISIVLKILFSFFSFHKNLNCQHFSQHINDIHVPGPFTLAKTKIQKTCVFCCTVYTARKTHNIRVFWHEKRMREKTWISYCFFGKWCACATSLYLWPYVVRITSRAAVGWFCRRSRTTWPKTRI